MIEDYLSYRLEAQSSHHGQEPDIKQTENEKIEQFLRTWTCSRCQWHMYACLNNFSDKEVSGDIMMPTKEEILPSQCFPS